MERHSSGAESGRLKPYLTTWGAVALSFGCAVGWGAFIMPGTAFLPVAGPLGTLIGLGIGAAVMFLVGRNYHYLIQEFPEAGGAYGYVKRVCGGDHGFICGWFLILTYVAIAWANATALVLVAASACPPGFASWRDYMAVLGSLDGREAIPAFYAVEKAIGGAGLVVLCLTTLAHIPVHVVTADVELQEDYAEKGFDSIVLKPVTVGTLGPLLAGLSERKN